MRIRKSVKYSKVQFQHLCIQSVVKKRFTTNSKIEQVFTIKFIQNSLSRRKIEIQYSGIMLYFDPFLTK